MNKKILVLSVLLISIITLVGCGINIGDIFEEHNDQSAYDYTEQCFEVNGQMVLSRTYAAHDGYCWYAVATDNRMGETLYLGCNDDISNYYLKWEGINN
jgi:prenyltransferase beta subunit